MLDTVTDCYMKTIQWLRNALFWWPCDSHACLDFLEFSKWNKFYNYTEIIKFFPNILYQIDVSMNYIPFKHVRT